MIAIKKLEKELKGRELKEKNEKKQGNDEKKGSMKGENKLLT